MKGSTGILLIAFGLIMLYVVLSDKYSCFAQFFECLTGADYATPEGYTRGTETPATPSINPQSGSGFSIWELLK